MPKNMLAALALAALISSDALAARIQEGESPWINDNPEYVAGRFGDGLKFDCWRSRLFLKTPGLFNAKEGTVQFWLSPCEDVDKINSWASIFGSGASKRQETKFATIAMTLVPPHLSEGASRLGCGVSSRSPGKVDASPVDWKKGEWRAIAMSWGANGLKLYIDGKLVASKDNAPVALDEEPDYLSFGGGTCKRFELFANCVMDEIEISDCARPASYIEAYAKAKTPPSPDEHVLALNHCDKSAASAYWRMTPSYRETHSPSAIWNSGFFDDYGTFKYDREVELPFTLVNPSGKTVEFKVSVDIKDIKGRQVGTKSETFKIEREKIENTHMSPGISEPGWYSYKISVASDGKTLMDETHSFVVLPEVPQRALDASNYFGNHLCGTRKNDFFTQAGTPWERDMVSFTWWRVQPERGVWDWRAGDFIVAEAKKNGMKLLGILGHPAAWAATEDVSRWKRPVAFASRAPRDLAEFSEYVYKTVSRYKNDVKYWEIWNEPDWNRPDKGGLGFSGTDAEYLAVLKTAYEAAKKADPDCVVVSGGFVPHAHLIEYIVKNGGAKYFDVLGMHRYRPWEDLERYAKMVGKPAWQTEHLVSSPEDVASDAVNGLKGGFEKCFYQDANTSCMTHFDVGAFEAYGWEPQPVYFAMANFAAKIGGKRKDGKIEFDRMKRLLDGFVFDKGEKSQTIAIHFNYSGPNKLKISFIPSSDGAIKATNLMGPEQSFDGKKGVPLTTEVENTLFLEGAVDPGSLRVASFEEGELLQNADFKLLEGDIGIDKLAGMRPKGWHLEREKGSIGMTRLDDGSYAVDFKSPGGSRPIRISQTVVFANPGHYTLSAEFMRKSGNPAAYFTIYDHKMKKGGVWRNWTSLPENEWKSCAISFDVDEAKSIGMVMGLDRGDGELLLRNPRLVKSVDPELLKRTVFVELAPYANQSLDDETANDGKGGWADMGQTNLSLIQTGLRDYGKELFKIATSGNACVMLGDGKKKGLPDSVENIAIGAKLAKLDFLCSALYVSAKNGESAGKCLIRYADGSSAEFPFVRGKDVDDWFPPMIGKDVRVAETVRTPDGGDRAVFIASWTNPHPEKEIKSISFLGEKKAIWAILAVSGLRN